MKSFARSDGLVFVLLVCLAVGGLIHPAVAATARLPAFVTAAFDDNCEDLLVREIQGARREILVAIYVFTRPRVVNAIVNAAGRGVRVRVKYDARQASYKGMRKVLRRLRSKGAQCSGIHLGGRALMHHKFMVIDGLRVLTGSFNYTWTASRENYENIVLIESPQVAAAFAREFEKLASH